MASQSSGQEDCPINVEQDYPIWDGVLDWSEKQGDETIQHYITCQVSAKPIDEVSIYCWAQHFTVQIAPKNIIGKLGIEHFKSAKTVSFSLENCVAKNSLTTILDSGFAGCVFVNEDYYNLHAYKVIILLYIKEKDSYLGLIPHNQRSSSSRLKNMIQEYEKEQKTLDVFNKMQQLSLGGSGNPS